MYRISLLPNSNSLAENLAVIAARVNGGLNAYSLEQIKTVADGNILEYPSLYPDTTCEIIGDHILHLDRKVGDNYETVLILEQVDILEVPTISSYENTSLLDDNNHELLN